MLLHRRYAVPGSVPRALAGVLKEVVAPRCTRALAGDRQLTSGKAGLLAAAVQAALAGGVRRADVPVDERPGIQRVIEETDPRRQLELYAATQPGVWGRVGPLLRVLEQAAMTDDALVELQRRHIAQRRDGLRRFADLLAERGAMRPDLSIERAADILFTVCAQPNYDALVGTLGWTAEEYRDWVAETLAHALLLPPP